MNKKLLLFAVVPLCVGLVVAIGYYAILSFNVNIIQPIDVTYDGDSVFGENFAIEDFDCLVGDSCIGDENVRIDNSADEFQIVQLLKTSELDVNYVGKLELTKKDITTWQPSENPEDKIEIIYTVVGNEFEVSGVPEGYTLIYYKDEIVGLEGRLANPQPAIIVSSDIGNLPQNDDANIDEFANYCAEPDNYEHCKGAKLWVVNTLDIDDGNLNWENMANYYYETDLVYYFANSEGEITVPANSFIEFYPQVSIDKYAEGGETSVEIRVI